MGAWPCAMAARGLLCIAAASALLPAAALQRSRRASPVLIATPHLRTLTTSTLVQAAFYAEALCVTLSVRASLLRNGFRDPPLLHAAIANLLSLKATILADPPTNILLHSPSPTPHSLAVLLSSHQPRAVELDVAHLAPLPTLKLFAAQVHANATTAARRTLPPCHADALNAALGRLVALADVAARFTTPMILSAQSAVPATAFFAAYLHVAYAPLPVMVGVQNSEDACIVADTARDAAAFGVHYTPLLCAPSWVCAPEGVIFGAEQGVPGLGDLQWRREGKCAKRLRLIRVVVGAGAGATCAVADVALGESALRLLREEACALWAVVFCRMR